MGSAKVIIKEQDRSAIVPSFPGIYGGIVINSDKGPVNKPVLITSENQLIDMYGQPNLKKGVGFYSAATFLSQSNKLWIVRAAHSDIKYSAALVRTKIKDIPTDYPDPNYEADPIVKPINGLTKDELDAYSFPLYASNRTYETLDNTLIEDVTNSKVLQLNKIDNLKVNDYLSFGTSLDLNAINDPTTQDGENLPLYEIKNLYSEQVNYDKVTVDTAVDVTEGDEVYNYSSGTAVAYDNHPKVVRSATNTTEFLVTNADLIAPNDVLTFDTNGTVTTTFVQKDLYTETQYFAELDNLVTLTTDTEIIRMTHSEFEERDAFLILENTPGEWGNKISIGIAPSSDYDDAFYILVYYEGVLVEKHLVSRKYMKDGFGKQLYIEDVINGNSNYIQVKDNLNNVDSNGDPIKPLYTNYSLWRKNPKDIFNDNGNTLIENLLKGDTEVKLDTTDNLSMGDRIKFQLDENTLSAEYKISSIDSSNNTLILDREIVEDEIKKTWIDENGNSNNTKVYKFDSTLNDANNGIIDGVQYYKISKLDKVYYNYKIGSNFIISGEDGILLDAGANLLNGGDDGSAVTVGDYMTAADALGNEEETPLTLLLDGGVTQPAYAQKLITIAENHGLTHVYLSDDPLAEDSVTYAQAVVDYKDSLNINSHLGSLFAGWVKIFDQYNQKEVWVSPESFAAASQSFTTRNYQMWYPAAGWTRGKILALDVKVKFTEGERDYLVDNRINPIRYKKGSGLVIWGNETLLSKPSPMQLRSVAMLLIVIKYGLESFLEFETFELNNEATWTIVEGAINGFMRDEIQAKGGVYDYQVAVKDIITKSDIDNRRMPVFLGIKPTMDIQEIPVTLAIFNSSVDIQVSV